MAGRQLAAITKHDTCFSAYQFISRERNIHEGSYDSKKICLQIYWIFCYVEILDIFITNLSWANIKFSGCQHLRVLTIEKQICRRESV